MYFPLLCKSKTGACHDEVEHGSGLGAFENGDASRIGEFRVQREASGGVRDWGLTALIMATSKRAVEIFFIASSPFLAMSTCVSRSGG